MAKAMGRTLPLDLQLQPQDLLPHSTGAECKDSEGSCQEGQASAPEASRETLRVVQRDHRGPQGERGRREGAGNSRLTAG